MIVEGLKMKHILVAHSIIVTAVLEESGKIQQIYEDLNEDFVEGVRKLHQTSSSEVITDSKFVSTLLNDSNIPNRIILDNKILKEWRINRYYKLLENTGTISSFDDYDTFLKATATHEARHLIKQAAGKRDELAAQIIQTIDDLQKTYNLNANRLYELYSLHFPELVDAISNPTTLAKLIVSHPLRRMMSKEILEDSQIASDKINFVVEAIDNSLGGEYSDVDLEPVKNYATALIEISNQLNKLENWIDKEMVTIAPNLTAVAGANVGARLISAFGSLRNLAMRSSSKIQTVGAERALYSALKKHGNPPKHGIIFQIPEVGNSPFWLRGKIARAYSGKIAIAARLDTFEGEFQGDKLRENLRVLEGTLREKFPTPPIKPKKEGKQTHPMRRKRRRRSQR
jgi:nucleolar protein 56